MDFYFTSVGTDVYEAPRPTFPVWAYLLLVVIYRRKCIRCGADDVYSGVYSAYLHGMVLG